MLDINSIKFQYPSNLHQFDRGLLREYLQYLILSVVFSHKNGRKLSFLGGTCLRIVYGLPRFSEDLDFDNKDLSFAEFEEIGESIKKALEKQGFVVSIRFIKLGSKKGKSFSTLFRMASVKFLARFSLSPSGILSVKKSPFSKSVLNSL